MGTETKRQGGSSSGRWAAVLDALDPQGRDALSAEVDEALSRRIRDLDLKGGLHRLYLDTSWRRRSRLARAWLIWSMILSGLMIPLDWLHAPALLYPSGLLRLCVLPIAYAALAWVWSRPRADWVEGATLPLAVIMMMTGGGVLGLFGEEQTLYRYLTAALLVGSTALLIFPVTLAWTIGGAGASIACFVGFGLLDPVSPVKDTLAFAVFFALILGAVVRARRTKMILQQHAFLLNLRGALQERALAGANARLALLANTDALTGLPNRRAFEDEAARLWSDPSDPPQSFGIVLFDIDHFKRLNDTAGHAEGDRCLAAIARAIREVLPSTGMCARYGGEEFIAILRNAGPRDVLRLAEHLRATIEALAWPNPGIKGPVTVSLGLAVGETDRRSETLAALIDLADAALYRSKAEGRNRIVPSWEPTLGEAIDRPFLPAQLCA